MLLLRHAEARPAARSGRDEDRPLTDRGIAQARYIADWLAADAEPAWRPHVVYVSAAERSRHTGAIVAERLGVTLRSIPELGPDVTPQGLVSIASQSLANARPVMLVGHNPNLHSLLDLLSASAPPLGTGELVIVDGRARIVDRRRMPEA